jgi:hypothetical protein
MDLSANTLVHRITRWRIKAMLGTLLATMEVYASEFP